MDFESVEAAERLMESEAKYNIQVDGVRLYLEYSHSGPGPWAQGDSGATSSVAGGAALDWVCNMCSAVNFARRTECYQCSSVRPRNPRRVNSEPEGPSDILKVSGLEAQLSEEELHQLFSAHVAVKDIRIVRDKFTGFPRGFAFVEFGSVAEASKILNMFQGHVPKGQSTALRICFARDRGVANGPSSGPHNSASSLAADALGAAQAMQQYAVWQPKAFNEEAIKPETNGALADAGAGLTNTEASGPGTNNGGAQSGFQYDRSTGYWYDPGSGYYYDANTGLYYNAVIQQWLAYDHATGQYTPCGASENGTGGDKALVTSQANPGLSSAAESAIAATEAVLGVGAQSTAHPNNNKERKRGAVIGAAPQLNPQGLLAAAQLAQEREEQARAACTKQPRQQPQQHGGKGNRAGNSGGGGGGGGAGHQPQTKGNKSFPSTAGVEANHHSSGGAVQGVIHRGKWSQRAAKV